MKSLLFSFSFFLAIVFSTEFFNKVATAPVPVQRNADRQYGKNSDLVT